MNGCQLPVVNGQWLMRLKGSKICYIGLIGLIRSVGSFKPINSTNETNGTNLTNPFTLAFEVLN